MNLVFIILALILASVSWLVLARQTRTEPAPTRRSLTALRLLRDCNAALLPSANTSIIENQAGLSLGADIACVLSCMSSGTDLSSGGTLKLYSRVSSLVTDAGYGEGLDFVGHYMSITGKPVLFGVLKTVTPGAIENVDLTGITGTSEVSFTGTPNDDANIVFEQVAACTVGTAGGTFKYSLDGGVSWSGVYRLGTATSFAIPNTGVTVNFATGTLNAGDVASCVTVAPKWDATALTDAFTALKARGDVIPRVVHLCGDVADSTTLGDVKAAIADYETTGKRFSVVVCNARDNYPKAVFQGGRTVTAQLAGQTVTVASAGKTFTRSAGSFIADGFVVGDEVKWAGFTNAGNNASFVISTLTATVMTCSTATGLVDESTTANTSCSTAAEGESITVAGTAKTYTRSGGDWTAEGFKVGMTVTFGGFSQSSNNGKKTLADVTSTVLTVTEASADEATVYGATVTAIESDSAWQTALDAIVGASPSTETVTSGVLIAGGRAYRPSPVDGFQRRRPAAWAITCRWMAKDVKTSPGRVDNTPLEGWTITDANGNPQEHDERTQGGLLAKRIACLRTFSELGVNGVYCALPVTLDNDGAPLSLLNFRGVACLAANVVQGMTTRFLQSTFDRNDDGTIASYEAARFEKKVLAELKRQLLTPSLGGTDPGPRASSVSFKMATDVDLRVVGAAVPTQTKVNMLGIFLDIENQIVVS